MSSGIPRIYTSFAEFEREELRRLDSMNTSVDDMVEERFAEDLDFDWAELPASPCLASRLYTGTPVTPSRLAAVSAGEATVRRATAIAVVRCRIRDNEVLVEVADPFASVTELSVVGGCQLRKIVRPNAGHFSDMQEHVARAFIEGGLVRVAGGEAGGANPAISGEIAQDELAFRRTE